MNVFPTHARERAEAAFKKIPPLTPGSHAILVVGLGTGALVDRLLIEYGQPDRFVTDGETYDPYATPEWFPKRGLPIWVIDPHATDVAKIAIACHWYRFLDIGQLRIFHGEKALEHLEAAISDPLSIPLSAWVASPDSNLPAHEMQHIVERVGSAMNERNRRLQQNVEAQRIRGAIRTQERHHSNPALSWRSRFAPGRKLKVLVCAVRFGGSYLWQCGSSLAQSFERLGHETVFLCERNNFQNITPVAFQQTVNDFGPDMIVWINSTRAYFNSAGTCTDGIVFCSWLQDPPVMDTLRLKEVAVQHCELDFYFSCAKEWSAELEALGYGETPLVQVPTDPALFTPFPPPESEWFTEPMDISYIATIPDDAVAIVFGDDSGSIPSTVGRDLYRDVYRQFEERLLRGERLLKVEDYRAIIERYFHPDWLAQHQDRPEAIEYMAKSLENIPGRVALRGIPPAWLAEAGFDVHVFGPGWRKHPILGPFSRGMIPYGTPLASMLRASKIHLCIHPIWTLTMKVLDALATGTFPLVRRVDGDRESGPITDWFEENRDVVLFTEREELLDKTRYYLNHPKERQAIAQRGREIALRHFTYDHLAATMLASIRKRFNRSVCPA